MCQACAGKQRALLIGITCGLSAAFVAGQLDACMDAGPQRCLPALLGFNPLQQARYAAGGLDGLAVLKNDIMLFYKNDNDFLKNFNVFFWKNDVLFF